MSLSCGPGNIHIHFWATVVGVLRRASAKCTSTSTSEDHQKIYTEQES